MKAIVDNVLSENKSVWQATSAYIEDIYIDESIIPADCVTQYLTLGWHVRIQNG